MHKTYLDLASVMLLYSASTITMKLASQSVLFSFAFFAYFAVAMLLLFAYAYVWQGLLHKLPLFLAYSAKGLTIVYGLIAGALFFAEPIGLQSVAASVLVIVGIYLVASDGT